MAFESVSRFSDFQAEYSVTGAAAFQIATISECRYRRLRVPATKIDTKNPAISMDCWVFVFKVEPSPQQNQWLSFVGSNHLQPMAVGMITVGGRGGARTP